MKKIIIFVIVLLFSVISYKLNAATSATSVPTPTPTVTPCQDRLSSCMQLLEESESDVTGLTTELETVSTKLKQEYTQQLQDMQERHTQETSKLNDQITGLESQIAQLQADNVQLRSVYEPAVEKAKKYDLIVTTPPSNIVFDGSMLSFDITDIHYSIGFSMPRTNVSITPLAGVSLFNRTFMYGGGLGIQYFFWGRMNLGASAFLAGDTTNQFNVMAQLYLGYTFDM